MSDNIIFLMILLIMIAYAILFGLKIYKVMKRDVKSKMQIASLVVSSTIMLLGFITPLALVISIVVSCLFLMCAYLVDNK